MEKMKFSYITPRPVHNVQDKSKQEEFKKNLDEVIGKYPKKELFFSDECQGLAHIRKLRTDGLKKALGLVLMILGRHNFYLYSAVNPKNGEFIAYLHPMLTLIA